jgi:hypothetical protein
MEKNMHLLKQISLSARVPFLYKETFSNCEDQKQWSTFVSRVGRVTLF